MNGKEYAEIRNQMNMTQAFLASQLGVTPETISRRETGAMKLNTEAAIAINALLMSRSIDMAILSNVKLYGKDGKAS